MDMKELVNAYRQELMDAVDRIDATQLQKAVDILMDVYRRDGQVFIFGNGGSAATANHFVCDFGKNAVLGNQRRFRVLSVSDNIEKVTALGNDIAYDQIFRQQLMNLMRPGDVAIAISASGSSPNVVQACEYTKELGNALIVLAGFQGGKIAPMGDASLVATLQSYERVEDIHLIILHMLVCYMKENQALFA